MDDITTSQEEIVEAEIVEEKPSSNLTDTDQATIVVSLGQLIKSHIASIDKLREEVKKHREMIADGFANDSVYQELDTQAKEAIKKKNAAKQQIAKQPAVITLVNKAKSMSAELKEKQMALSDYLLEYQRMTGVNEIEGEDGDVREIVHIAKAVRKPTKK